MIASRVSPKQLASKRTALRRRVKAFYQHLSGEAWNRCYLFLDPTLRADGKVVLGPYSASLAEFKARYGSVQIWHIDISLHLEKTKRHRDDRPFAYVYVFWQDTNKAFHVFRERWVLDSARWYTRVAGLVAAP